MDASLDILQGIEKNLLTKLPSPPVWKLITSDLEGQVCPQYPTFTGSQQPQIQVKVDTLHNKELLARLTADPKHGFFPPFKFTLIRAADPFHDKKQHAEARFPWSKGDWSWSAKFSCRQMDAKTKTYKNVSLRIDTPLGRTGKRVKELINLFRERESLKDLRNHLLAAFHVVLQEKGDSYENFLKYCGLAQLHHLGKQRKKLEAQMSDAYEAWIQAFREFR